MHEFQNCCFVVGRGSHCRLGRIELGGVIGHGVIPFEAPLGLIMLGLTALLGVFFIAYVLSLQGSVLMDNRRHAKEMTVQRELADKAEASRFTDLRMFLQSQHEQAQAQLLGRMDLLEAHLAARAQDSDNNTAAYVGQLEHQLRTKTLDGL